MTELDHIGCRELLPWVVNGTLSESEREATDRHLEICSACRAELVRCRDLAAEVEQEAGPVPSAHPAQLTRLLERIERGDLDRGDEPEPRTAPEFTRRLRAWMRSTPVPVRWLVLAQAAVLVLLVVVGPVATTPTGAFRTLAADAPVRETRRVRVVFAPETTETEIRRLLLELRAEIVGGPSALGAYALALAPVAAGEPDDAVLDLLRQDPRVLFAEPISGDDVATP